LCRKCYDIEYAKSHRKNINAASKKWSDKNLGKKRELHLKGRYGISEDMFQLQLKSQGGRCCICKTEPATNVDHNHKTGKVRGILCGNCNRGLGLLRENIDNLQRAIEYIKTWDEK
jgi:hypothetical protein